MIESRRIVILLCFVALGCGDDPRFCPNDLPLPDALDCDAGPSYQNDIVPLIMARCFPCHFPGGIEASTHDFSKYSVILMQKSRILNQIHACLMPPAGQPDLDMMQRFTFQSWLICGARDN